MRGDGNEGKQAEMSIHTYHTHIHMLRSGNLLAQLSCPKFGPSPFVPYLGVWERKLLAPPHLAMAELRQIPLAGIN